MTLFLEAKVSDSTGCNLVSLGNKWPSFEFEFEFERACVRTDEVSLVNELCWRGTGTGGTVLDLLVVITAETVSEGDVNDSNVVVTRLLLFTERPSIVKDSTTRSNECNNLSFEVVLTLSVRSKTVS